MSNPWEKYKKEDMGGTPWNKYAPTLKDEFAQQPTPQLTSEQPQVDVPPTRDLLPKLKEAGQTFIKESADVAQGLVEGPAAVISGAASFIPAVLSQAPNVLGGLMSGKPTAGLATAKDEMDKVMEAYSYKPKSNFGKTIAEVAASPFTVAHELISKGVKALGGSDEQVKAGQFTFDAALLGLPHVAKKLKRGEKLTPKEVEEVKVKVPEIQPDVLTEVLNKVSKVKEGKVEPVPQAKFSNNQSILDGLQVEINKRTGPRRAQYQKALNVVKEHPEDIKTLDLSKISKNEGKTRKLVQKLMEERDAKSTQDLVVQDASIQNQAPEGTAIPTEVPKIPEVAKKVEEVVKNDMVNGFAIKHKQELKDTISALEKVKEVVKPEMKIGVEKQIRDLTREISAMDNVAKTFVKEKVPTREEVAQKYVKTAEPEMVEPSTLPTIEPIIQSINFARENQIREIRENLKQKLAEKKAAEKLAEETKVPEAVEVKQRTAEDLAKMYSEWKAKKVEKLNTQPKPLDASFNNLIQEKTPLKESDLAAFDDSFKTFKTYDELVEYATETGTLGRPAQDPTTQRWFIEPTFKELDDYAWNSVEESRGEFKGDRSADRYTEEGFTDWELTDTGTRSLWDVLNNERGAISFSKKEIKENKEVTLYRGRAKESGDSAQGRAQFYTNNKKRAQEFANTNIDGGLTPEVVARKVVLKKIARENDIREAAKETDLYHKFYEEELIDLLDEPRVVDNLINKGFDSASTPEYRRNKDNIFVAIFDNPFKKEMNVINKEFKNPLRNQRGSVDVTGLKITADKLKQIKEKADNLGKSVEELLDMVGVEPETAQKILQQLVTFPQMRDEVRKADPIIEGIINPDPASVVLHRNSPNNKGSKNVPLTAETFKAIHTARKLEWGTSPLSKFMAGTETRIHAFERYGKGVKEQFFDKWLAKFTDSERERRAVVKEVKNLGKTYTTREREIIGINAVANQKGGMSALAADGIKEIPPLTPKLADAIVEMRQRYDVLWDRINYVRSHTGLKPLPKLDNYFAFIHKQNALRKAGISDSLLTAQPSKINGALQNFKGTFFPFDKPRKITDIPLELDIFNAFEKYMSYAMKEIHVAPIAALAKEAAMGKVKVKNLKNGFRLIDRNPGLAKLLLEWSDEILGIDPSTSALTSKLPSVARGFTVMHRNVVAGMIFGNLRTVMVQPTALKGVASLTTFRDTLSGVGKMMTEKPFKRGMTEAAVKSNVLSVRSAELILTEIAEAMSLGKVVGAKKIAYDITSAPMNFIDALVAESGWNAGYGYAKRVLKLGEKEAVQWADDLVIKTQGAGVRGVVSPIQSVSSVKWLTMLQTYAIADFNFIARDLLGIKNPDVTKVTQMKRVLRYLTGAALVNMTFQLAGLDAPNPSPIQAFGESKEEGDSDRTAVAKAMMEFLEVVPIVGGSAKFGSSLFGPLGELATQTPEALEAVVKGLDWDQMTDKQKLQTKLLVGKVLGLSLGIPMTNQIAKSIRTSSNGGDWYDIILGIYVKAGRATPPRPPQLENEGMGGLEVDSF